MENIEYMLLGFLFISQIIIIFVLMSRNKKSKLGNIKGDKFMKILEEKIDKINEKIESYNKIIENSKKIDKEDGKKVERMFSKKLNSLKKDLLTLDSSKEIFDKIEEESQKRKNDIYNESNKLNKVIENNKSSIISKITNESNINKVEFNKLNKHFEDNTIGLKNKLDDKFKKLNRKLDDDLEENFDEVLERIEEIKEDIEGYEGNFKMLQKTVNSILNLLKQEGIEIRNIIPPDVEDEKVFIEMQKALVVGIDSLTNNSRHLALNYKDLEELPATRARLAELEQIKEKKEYFDKLISRINGIKKELIELEKIKSDLDDKLNEKNSKLSNFKEKEYYDLKLSGLNTKNEDKKSLENSILNLEELIKKKKEIEDEIERLNKGKSELMSNLNIKEINLSEIHDKIKELNGKIDTIKNNKKETSKLTEDDKKNLKELEDKKEYFNSLDDTISQIKNMKEELEKLKDFDEEELSNKKKELKKLEIEIKGLNRIKEEKESFDEINKEISELNDEIKKLDNKIEELKTESKEKIKSLGLGGNNE